MTDQPTGDQPDIEIDIEVDIDAGAGAGPDLDLGAAELAALPIEEVRRRRAEGVEVETGLSYVRRLVQGPIDIVHGEQARRGAGAGGDLPGLLEDLPGLLGEVRRPAGLGRLPTGLEPTAVDPALQAELDALVGDGRIGSVTTLGDDELAELAEALEVFERRVSELRRGLHRRIDALQAELVRRYRSGEAVVEAPPTPPRQG